MGQDGAEQFIQVKSSISTSKAFFEMSHQEVNAAQRLGDKYSLYRVCGVGSMQPTLLRIVNPVQKWADGQIKVCVVLYRRCRHAPHVPVVCSAVLDSVASCRKTVHDV